MNEIVGERFGATLEYIRIVGEIVRRAEPDRRVPALLPAVTQVMLQRFDIAQIGSLAKIVLGFEARMG